MLLLSGASLKMIHVARDATDEFSAFILLIIWLIFDHFGWRGSFAWEVGGLHIHRPWVAQALVAPFSSQVASNRMR